MQYCAQVEHLHAQVAPDMPMEAFVAAINPQALGFQSRDQLYAPVEFAVQIAGPLNGAAGAIRVQVPVHANSDWLSVMKHRFSSLIGQPLLPLNQLEFRTVDGRSIANVPPEQLRNVGKLHVFVKGKELRLPAVPAIPIEYSVTKMRDIDRWITDTVEEKLPALVARYLSPCQNAEQLQAAVRGDGPLVKAIEAAVQGADRAQWAEFVRTRHVNPPLVMPVAEANKAAQAIASEVLLGEVRRMVDAAAPQIRKHFAELESARIAKDLTGRHNPDHFAPIAGLVAHEKSAGADGESTIENVNEFYRNLTEDIVTMPSVREAIAAAIYTRPMTSIGCRWKPGQQPDAEAGVAGEGEGEGEEYYGEEDVPYGEAYREDSPELGRLSPRRRGPPKEKEERSSSDVTPSTLAKGDESYFVLLQTQGGIVSDLDSLFRKGKVFDGSETQQLAYMKQEFRNLFDGTHVDELEALAARFDPDIIRRFPVAQSSIVGGAVRGVLGRENKAKSDNLALAIVQRYRYIKNPPKAKSTEPILIISKLNDEENTLMNIVRSPLPGAASQLKTKLEAVFAGLPKDATEDLQIMTLKQRYPNLFDSDHVRDLEKVVEAFASDIKEKVPVEKAGYVGGAWQYLMGTTEMEKTNAFAKAIVQRYQLVVRTQKIGLMLSAIAQGEEDDVPTKREKMLQVLVQENVVSVTNLGVFAGSTLLAILKGVGLMERSTSLINFTQDQLKALQMTTLDKFIKTEVAPPAKPSVVLNAPPPKETVPEKAEEVLSPKPARKARGTSSGEQEAAEEVLSPKQARKGRATSSSAPTKSATANMDAVTPARVQQYAKASFQEYMELVRDNLSNASSDRQTTINEALAMYLGGQRWQGGDTTQKNAITMWWRQDYSQGTNIGSLKPYVADLQKAVTTLKAVFGTKDKSLTLNQLVVAFPRRANLAAKAANIESSIEAHHPWNAMIHNTIRPMLGGAYPTYYNALHTKQDMTSQAKFMGNEADTYRAYHLFGGVPIAPLSGLQRIGCHAKQQEPCERTKKYSEAIYTKARDAAKKDRDDDITRDSAAYRSQVRGETLRRPPMDMESEVPPLVPMTRSKAPPVIPIGNKAPPVLPIGCGASSGDEDEEPMHTKADISEARARMLLGSMFDSSDDETAADLSPRPIRSSIPPCPPTIAAPMALIEDEDDNPFGMPTLKQALAAKK